MIKKVTIIETFRVLKKEETFHFKAGVNLLVGEQGSGKSSLLQLLMGKQNAKKYLVPTTTDNNPVATRSFDFEKDNPRVSNRVETMAQFACVMASHGQYVRKMILELTDETQFKDVTILMDEPDMSLSIRSCYQIIQSFKKAADHGCQLILAVHNPIVISAFPEVLSMEHRKWMPSSDFIKTHTDSTATN
jgi:predicted ATPase